MSDNQMITDPVERIKALQRIYGLKDDGIVGPVTRNVIYQDIFRGTAFPPVTVTPPDKFQPIEGLLIPQDALNMIFEQEGIDQPWLWPGGDSGVSIGRGYDLSAVSKGEFSEDWGDILPPADFVRLATSIGMSGEIAHEKCLSFKGIVQPIKKEDADKVFIHRTLPKVYQETSRAFPGFTDLQPLAQGALVSLIYNRGSKMDGDRRIEMRAIQEQVPKKNYIEMAAQLRKMKRLWDPSNGVIKHREAEAELMFKAAAAA